MNRGRAGLIGISGAWLVAIATLTGCQPGTGPFARTVKAGVQRADFGKTKDGTPVEVYTLTNSHGLVAKVMTYGATVIEVDTPDRLGKLDNITLRLDSVAKYESSSPYLGATVGRYANRIAKGAFTVDGKEYTLAKNNGPNSLHGGNVGWSKLVWKAEPLDGSEPAVKFTLTSPDMNEGFPGTVSVSVIYALTNNNELRVDYKATTDKATPINLTNHCYWNLSGFESKNVLDEIVTINADRYTPVDATQIPTGELKAVKGTPMDFTSPVAIGARIGQVEGGYDHNYVLRKSPGELAFAAKVADPQSGRVMEVSTTEPGIQFYTGNFLDGSLTDPAGHVYAKNAGFCLEAQHYPDSPNQPAFPTTILKPGQTYTQTTVHKFSVK